MSTNLIKLSNYNKQQQQTKAKANEGIEEIEFEGSDGPRVISVVFAGEPDEIVDYVVRWLAQFTDRVFIEDRGNVVMELRVGWLGFHGLDENDNEYRDELPEAVWSEELPSFTFGASELADWMQTYRADFIRLLRGGPVDDENTFLKVFNENYDPQF